MVAHLHQQRPGLQRPTSSPSISATRCATTSRGSFPNRLFTCTTHQGPRHGGGRRGHLRRRRSADAGCISVGDFTIKARPSTRSWCPAPRPRRRSLSCRPMPQQVCRCRARHGRYTASHAWNGQHQIQSCRAAACRGRCPSSPMASRSSTMRACSKTASGTVGTIDRQRHPEPELRLDVEQQRPSPTRLLPRSRAPPKRRRSQSRRIAQPVLRRHRESEPATGTLTISYMAQGRWYVVGWRQRLPQRAGRQLRRGHFTTGAFVVTLGRAARTSAVPDPDVERADPGNATSQPHALKASQALQLPRRRQERSAGDAHHHLATRAARARARRPPPRLARSVVLPPGSLNVAQNLI